LEEIIPAYRDRLAFWGTIGTQTTMPFGSPEDVRRAVEACAEWVRQGAAIVVAPTHVIEPDVPLENVEALVEACNAPLQVGSA
jgi:uroporphyrinogen decarboxylase